MVPRRKGLRELVAESANDCGVPKTFTEMVGWVVRFFLRLFDEPVLRVLQEDGEERGDKRPLVLTKESMYDIAKKTGRNIYSVRRSVRRLREMGKTKYYTMD